MNPTNNTHFSGISRTSPLVQSDIEEEEVHSQTLGNDGGMSMTAVDGSQHSVIVEAKEHAMNNFIEEKNILLQVNEDPRIEPGSFVPINANTNYDALISEAEKLLQESKAPSNKADVEGLLSLSNKIIKINGNLSSHLRSFTSLSIIHHQRTRFLSMIDESNAHLRHLQPNFHSDYAAALQTIEQALEYAREAANFIQTIEQQDRKTAYVATSVDVQKKRSGSSSSMSDLTASGHYERQGLLVEQEALDKAKTLIE